MKAKKVFSVLMAAAMMAGVMTGEQQQLYQQQTLTK